MIEKAPSPLWGNTELIVSELQAYVRHPAHTVSESQYSARDFGHTARSPWRLRPLEPYVCRMVCGGQKPEPVSELQHIARRDLQTLRESPAGPQRVTNENCNYSDRASALQCGDNRPGFQFRFAPAAGQG